MPVQPTYPGVYIEELPSGTHSITGVATSITAFIGRALSGPTNEATTIESYADFERAFGGAWLESSLGYAVQDFYQNGGNTAVIVRLFNPSAADLQSIQDTISAVLNVPDPADGKPATLAATMTQAAQDAQLAAGRTQGGLLASAATTEASRPSTTSVESAAQAAAAAINNAAQAVASATDTTSPSTPQSLSTAMQAVANSYTTDPAKTAAGLVASAASAAAAKKSAATSDVQTAANGAAQAISAATQAVVNVTDKTSPSTPASLAAAMTTQADTYTTDPAKTAAGLVASAATTESTYTSTLATTRQAAKQAANAYTAPVTRSGLSVGGLPLIAAFEGTWGQNLRATIDFNIMQDVATAMQLNVTDLFNLTVRNSATGGLVETYRNVTLVESTRRLDKVLAAQSQLVRWNGSVPPSAADIAALTSAMNALPQPLIQQSIDDDVTAGQTQLANANKQLKNDKKAGKPPATLQADQQAIDQANKTLADARTAMVAADGDPLTEDQFDGPGNDVNKLGLYALEQVDLFNILCIPPYRLEDDNVDIDLVAEAASYCERRRAVLLVDAPSDWTSKDIAKARFADPNIDYVGTRSSNAALFFPRVMRPNPLRNNQLETFVPCGAVAGIFARTDAQRGVWKAPAGIEASLVGVTELSVPLTNLENGELNPLGINCLRSFPIYGPVVWGSRTLRGADAFADDYKYIPVRRLALFLEESLYRGTQWVVFEPNDEPLWAQIRLNVGAFMQNLFRQGAFQGQTPRDAYLVKCDSETTTPYDQEQGIVNILVGFAPLKPAEFVIIQIQQLAGQNQA